MQADYEPATPPSSPGLDWAPRSGIAVYGSAPGAYGRDSSSAASCVARRRLRTVDAAELSAASRRPVVEITHDFLLSPRTIPKVIAVIEPDRRLALVIERRVRTTISVDVSRLLFFAVILAMCGTAAGLTLGRAAAPTAAPAAPHLRPKWRDAATSSPVVLPPATPTTYPPPESAVSRLLARTQYLDDESASRVCDALEYAARAHEGQRRKSGEPFITHPIAVACILAELRMDAETVAAGLLHDVVEDTDATLDGIAERFGEGVATIVHGVTDAEGVADAENERELLLAMSEEWRVAVVKLADRLHNMRTLRHMPPHKQRRKARDTLRLFVPLARQLGVAPLEAELRTLAATHALRPPAAARQRRAGRAARTPRRARRPRRRRSRRRAVRLAARRAARDGRAAACARRAVGTAWHPRAVGRALP